MTKWLFWYSPSSFLVAESVKFFNVDFPLAPLPGRGHRDILGLAFLYHMHASVDGSAYAEILEWSAASGHGLTSGQSLSVGGVPGTFRKEGAVSAVEFSRRGTDTTVRTSLDEAEALKIAASL